jgi:putative nucleotidyltransferase with HDIG domain
MTRLEKLKEKVDGLYQEKKEDRADWAVWLYESHVFLVAEEAGRLADRFGANKELAMAAAMLHDLADAIMRREDPKHDTVTAKMAKEFLRATGFSKAEITVIVDDALKYHGCRDGQMPQTPEGKVLATADAVVHLTSGFYEHCVAVLKKDTPASEIKKWALPKLDRDFNDKIQFEEVREAMRPNYEKLKTFLLGQL